jgi:hypothetical protein
MDRPAPLSHLPRPTRRKNLRLDVLLFIALLLLMLMFLGVAAP